MTLDNGIVSKESGKIDRENGSCSIQPYLSDNLN